MIYSIPIEINTDYYKKLNLKKLLETNKGRFFTANYLTKLCEFKKSNTSVELRKAITELIAEGNPIVSNAKGFGYAIHQNQVVHYIKHLEFRINGINRRISDLRKCQI